MFRMNAILNAEYRPVEEAIRPHFFLEDIDKLPISMHRSNCGSIGVRGVAATSSTRIEPFGCQCEPIFSAKYPKNK